ncbi:MAG: AAA family ATPase [Candidatus Geothermarchaeota archaeon]
MGKNSVFKDPNKLSLSYIPSRIPHRETHLQRLIEYFTPVIEKNIDFEHVLLVGNTGVGKTLVAKHFERYLYKNGKGRVVPIYVNARVERSPTNILRKMIEKLSIDIPLRGYSFEEMYYILLKSLMNTGIKAVLILDDADHLFETNKDFIYKLSRIEEVFQDVTNVLSLVFVVHKIDAISKLDPWTSAGLHKNIILFENYTYDELLDILKFRAEEAFFEDTIMLESLETAADISNSYGFNARYAIELIYRAGLIADSRGERVVKPEHVRLARKETPPLFSLEELNMLQLHEKIILYTIAELLSSSDKAFLTTGEVERRYRENSLYFNCKPLGHTYFWKLINTLTTFGVISKRLSGKGYRGKTYLIGLPSLPAKMLYEKLLALLPSK